MTRLHRIRERHADGTWFTFGYRDGVLQAIYKRVSRDRGPSAGGVIIYDRPFWHRNAHCGKLGKRATRLLAEMPQIKERL